jgi:hypothetical protein
MMQPERNHSGGAEQRDPLEPQRAAKPANESSGEHGEEAAQQRWQHAKGPGTDSKEPRL